MLWWLLRGRMFNVRYTAKANSRAHLLRLLYFLLVGTGSLRPRPALIVLASAFVFHSFVEKVCGNQPIVHIALAASIALLGCWVLVVVACEAVKDILPRIDEMASEVCPALLKLRYRWFCFCSMVRDPRKIPNSECPCGSQKCFRFCCGADHRVETELTNEDNKLIW